MRFSPFSAKSRFFRLVLFVVFSCLFSLSAISFIEQPENEPLKHQPQDKQLLIQEGVHSNESLNAASPRLDAYSRILLNSSSKQRIADLVNKFNVAADVDANGELIADVFIQLNAHASPGMLAQYNVQTRTRVGDILVARAPLSGLNDLSLEPGIRLVQISHEGTMRLDSSLKSIGADKVHLGIDLPQGYRGNDVVVGIVDSGIDFTHPDFSDDNGSRILHLLEYTEGGGENEWTKNDIDQNPAGISQIDGNGDGGHGTHVSGIAVGGGQLNRAFTGVAPESDIVFVKGIRNQESAGGYRDTDVLAASQFIFEKADELGKPAVINLSIGSHFGPHDGTSLYEQALSSLVGEGRLIVAAAGNEGNDYIHAGGITTGNVLTESLIIPDGIDQRIGVSTWYESGVIDAAAVFAYDAQFNFIGQSNSIGVGFSLGPEPVVVGSDTLGFVTIDAITTEDPNNGDGNIIFIIDNNGDPSIDISQTIWAIGTQGETGGRMDSWINIGGRFYDQEVGFANETELVGNNEYSVGIPATAERVLSVGSYATKYTWFDIDGDSLTLNPRPTINDVAASSSRGPTRDGRISPDLMAPGLILFSALSSQMDEGIGYPRLAVLQGGGYLAQTGTSQASPHVAGTIALMLEAKPDLSYEEAVQILTETARTNDFTGTVPNNTVGAGYLDAHEAVKRVNGLPTSVDDSEDPLPRVAAITNTYPNPFATSATIEYTLSSDAPATLHIYNVTGQRIRTLIREMHAAGTYRVTWDGMNEAGRQVASGIYYATLEADQVVQTEKLVVLR